MIIAFKITKRENYLTRRTRCGSANSSQSSFLYGNSTLKINTLTRKENPQPPTFVRSFVPLLYHSKKELSKRSNNNNNNKTRARMTYVDAIKCL